MTNTVMTPIGFLYYPALFEPVKNKEVPTQEARFKMMLLFDGTAVASTAYQELRAAVKAAIAEKFGEAKANDAAFVRGLRLPFRPAAEKTYGGFEDGEIFISAWSKGSDTPPGVVNLKGEKIVVPGDVWGGQLARATVRPFAYDNSGNKGVGFYLEHVQIVKADMPRRDGKQSAEQAFAQTVGQADEQMRALGIDPATASPSGATSAADDLPF